MAVYRLKYLKENIMGIMAKEQIDCFCHVSINWLPSYNYSCSIKHALNGDEEIIWGAKVDGYGSSTSTIYHF